MQKLLKNNKGFTLVEVIVVAVIVLVLAAVAIPLYNGYIQDSRRNTASNIAGTLASGFGACIQSDNCDDATLITAATVTAASDGNTLMLGGNQITIPANYHATLVTATNSVHVCHGAPDTNPGNGTTGVCSIAYVYTN